ncbi:hypothetical protein NA56DRAFT_690949 [Hyaloscypha hepaticicola]|uniref:Uncharacterized protein n=1 Tax=Hyaloscypha hepaticicola TaxID=2082293 RepID=A0A2J6PY24_9HELO|nr:hypothetical protein NA56DRAFT_690949 [Hyaloscypha hepaticicola]
MPPRKRVSAPAKRVYKSATPLRQAKLTAPMRRIKSYGKKTGVQLSKLDNTLTQMDWLKMQQMKDLEQEEDEDQEFEEEIKKPKRKRRKTTGDEPSATPQMHTQTISQVWSTKSAPDEEEQELGQEMEKETKKRKSKRRKTAGDEPSRTPQFHTQTLTQLDRSFNSTPEEEDCFIFDVPSSTQSVKPSKVKKSPAIKATKKATTAPPPPESPAREMAPPQTPHRPLPREIPSSESPGTPLSVHSRSSATRRSPLNEISLNTPIPFNTNQKPQGSSPQLPKLEILNSHESGTHASQISRIPSTPSKRSSPAKSVRFALPDVEEEQEQVEEDNEGQSTPLIKLESTPYASQASGILLLKTEIEDSDAESEEEIEVPRELPAATGQVEEEGVTGQVADEDGELEQTIIQEEEDQPEDTASCYGEIGAETQFEVDKIIDSPRLSGLAPTTQMHAHADAEPETFRERTQIMESQRLATQYMESMAPRTATSDIFITLPSQHVTNILSRAKDHDMRPYAFPPTVCRLWIYEAKPVCALKYMAEIGPAKRAGEISDERGLGNADFNAKKGRSWHAYEILQLYELSDPLSLSKLIANEWLDEAPKRYNRVRPAVIDQLIANLKPPLFHTESEAIYTAGILISGSTTAAIKPIYQA